MIFLFSLIISIVFALLGFIAVFNGWFVPNIGILGIIGSIVTLVYLFNIFKRNRNKRLELGLMFSILMYLTLIIGVWVYSIWRFEAILSAASMMKLTLILVAVLISYLFFGYMRAQNAYKRRQGNLRNRNKESKESYFKRKSKDNRLDKSIEVTLILGEKVQFDNRFSHK